MSPLPDEDRYTITLVDDTVTDVDGCSLTDQHVVMGVLVGDVNGDGSVNVADILKVRDCRGQPVVGGCLCPDISCCTCADVDCSGSINVADILLVRDHRGNTLP